MKSVDQFKIAFHSLLNNKSRSFLTIIIAFIISFLVFAIMMISINFSMNIYDLQIDYINTNYPNILITKAEYNQNNVTNHDLIDKEYEKMIKIINNYDAVVSYVKLNRYNMQYYFLENKNYDMNETIGNIDDYQRRFSYEYVHFKFPLGINGALKEGRVWTEDDVGKNYVWVSDEFINKYFDLGYGISIGDEVWFHVQKYFPEEEFICIFSEKFIIKGIISSKGVKDYYQNDFYQVPEVYFDATYSNQSFDPSINTFSSMTVNYIPPQADYDLNEVYRLTKSMVKELKGAMILPNPSYKAEVRSDLIEALDSARLAGVIIIVLTSFLSLFILGLSIGSIANSIMISVDKNKKFFGLMKALGLKQKDIEGIVKKEAVFTIAIGIFFSTIFIYIEKPFFHNIMTKLINSLFPYEIMDTNYQAYTIIPLYLPFVIFFVFVIFSLFFSKSSLRSISKMDAITIINEVN